MDFGDIRSALHAERVDLRRVALMLEGAPEEWVEYALEQCERRRIGMTWSAGGRISQNPLDALEGASARLNRVVAVGERWRAIWELEEEDALFDWAEEVAAGLLDAYWVDWVGDELSISQVAAPRHALEVKDLWRHHQIELGALRRAHRELSEVVEQVSAIAKRASWAAMGPSQTSPEAVAARGWDRAWAAAWSVRCACGTDPASCALDTARAATRAETARADMAGVRDVPPTSEHVNAWSRLGANLSAYLDGAR
jgi:hypothetical protein